MCQSSTGNGKSIKQRESRPVLMGNTWVFYSKMIWVGPERSQVSSAASEPATRSDSKHVRVQRSTLPWQHDAFQMETRHLVFTVQTWEMQLWDGPVTSTPPAGWSPDVERVRTNRMSSINQAIFLAFQQEVRACLQIPPFNYCLCDTN